MFTPQEVSALKALLNGACPPKSKSRRRRPRAAPTSANPAPAPQRRRRRANKNAVSNTDGSIRLARTEFLAKVQLTSGALEKKISLVPASFSWLNNLSKSFDRIVWHSAVVEYRPYSSAMNSGSVAVGMDWNYSTSTVAREKALACTPSFMTSVFQPRSMALPNSLLMSRKSYIIDASNASDASPGQLLVSAAASDQALYCGDLYVKYNVTLSGTSS